jgi:hypothetical protein
MLPWKIAAKEGQRSPFVCDLVPAYAYEIVAVS